MKKKDIDNYKKTQKIVDEIILAMDDSIINENTNELYSFLETNKHSAQFIEKCCNEKRFTQMHRELEEAKNNRKLDSFLQKLDAHKPKRSKIVLTRGLSALIAAASIIALSFILYNNETNEEEKTVVGVTKKPMLILSDGNKIDLEQVAQDVIKNEELVIVKGKNEIRYSATSKKEIRYNRLIVPNKYSYNIVLCDGSEVCLNAGSELIYPENFSEDIREVELKGEAYFKVIKSVTPFVVKVNNAIVKVYGTEFNINSNYDSMIEATLISGSVGVTAEEGGEIMIKPNQMITINKRTQKCVVKEVDVENYISWKSGYFRYTDYAFTSVLNDISLWYGVKITISKELREKELLATLSISRTILLEETLRFIEKIMGVKIINEGGGHYSITE